MRLVAIFPWLVCIFAYLNLCQSLKSKFRGRTTHLTIPVIPHIKRNGNHLKPLLPLICPIPMQNLVTNSLCHLVRPSPIMGQIQNPDLDILLLLQILQPIDVDLQPGNHDWKFAWTRRRIRKWEAWLHDLAYKCWGRGDFFEKRQEWGCGGLTVISDGRRERRRCNDLLLQINKEVTATVLAFLMITCATFNRGFSFG